jgi:hypothetical protein
MPIPDVPRVTPTTLHQSLAQNVGLLQNIPYQIVGNQVVLITNEYLLPLSRVIAIGLQTDGSYLVTLDNWYQFTVTV